MLEKLNQFLNNGNMVEHMIACKYYPLLFPEQYYLAMYEFEEKLKLEEQAFQDAQMEDILYSSKC